MENYKLELEQNRKRNEKYMRKYEQWIAEKNLGDKTIRKHLSNIDLYINDYLNYYEITKMEDGIGMAFMFLDDWFIRKCLWSSKTSIKENAASIKKFYECMSEKNYVSKEDYKELCEEIKDNMDTFLESLAEYDDFDDIF